MIADTMLFARGIFNAYGNIGRIHVAIHKIDHISPGILLFHVVPIFRVIHSPRAKIAWEHIEIDTGCGHLIQLLFVTIRFKRIEGYP